MASVSRTIHELAHYTPISMGLSVLITISFFWLGLPVQNGLPENSSHLYTRCKPTRLCIVAEQKIACF